MQRFTEIAAQLVAWTGALVPALRRLQHHREDLLLAVSRRAPLPQLEREKLEAEDEQDAAVAELRKHRRHASARERACGGKISSADSAAAAVRATQLELRERHAGERAQALSEQLLRAEKECEEALRALPFTLTLDDLEGSQDDSRQAAWPEVSAEDRLALKTAELQQLHEALGFQASESQAARLERRPLHAEVGARREGEAQKLQMEPDFMCPIMHERMTEPVLAADGHTYERQAIETWLRMHNTSPMTGSPLAHRYLTENFALRHLISSYEAVLQRDRQEILSAGEDGRGEVSHLAQCSATDDASRMQKECQST